MKTPVLRPLLAAVPPDVLRAQARAAGVAAPHGFIRGLNADYDLDIYLDRLFGDIPPEDDLRFRHGSGDDERWILMERLPWDSSFFGRGMARLNEVIALGAAQATGHAGAVPAIQAALGEARTRGIDYVLATVDPRNLAMIRNVSATGFELIETRCHYHMPLAAPPAVRHATRLATAEDVPSLAHAARATINHFDRFHADPAIAPHDADRLMEKWVEASVLEGFADATLVPDVEAPQAFCTAKYHREHWDGWGLRLAQPVLSAVAPVHRGWYVKIISELNEHLRSIGAEHSHLITQITNNAVIHCWEKLGYRFGKGEHVFRCLLQPGGSNDAPPH